MRNHFLVPRSYSEWGINVPFEMDLNIRVRKDGEKLECIIPGFSGNKGNYVFDWNSFPEQQALSEENMMIYSAVSRISDLTPLAVYRQKMEIDYTGIFGSERQKKAEDFLKMSEKAFLDANFSIVMNLLAQLGYDLRQMISEGFFKRNKDSEDKLRQLVYAVAHRVEMDGNHLNETIEELSRKFSVIGIAPYKENAHLRNVLYRIKSFILTNGNKEPNETLEAYGLKLNIINTAKIVIEQCDKIFQFFDELTKSPLKLIKNKALVMDKINESILKLEFLLDGWSSIMDRWDEKTDEDDVLIVLNKMHYRLPVIPESEMPKKPILVENKNKRVKAGENWLGS